VKAWRRRRVVGGDGAGTRTRCTYWALGRGL